MWLPFLLPLAALAATAAAWRGLTRETRKTTP